MNEVMVVTCIFSMYRQSTAGKQPFQADLSGFGFSEVIGVQALGGRKQEPSK